MARIRTIKILEVFSFDIYLPQVVPRGNTFYISDSYLNNKYTPPVADIPLRPQIKLICCILLFI